MDPLEELMRAPYDLVERRASRIETLVAHRLDLLLESLVADAEHLRPERRDILFELVAQVDPIIRTAVRLK